MVLGAGLFAANLSTTFRLRKFGMKDGITYPITIEVCLSCAVLEHSGQLHVSDISSKSLSSKLLSAPELQIILSYIHE